MKQKPINRHGKPDNKFKQGRPSRPEKPSRPSRENRPVRPMREDLPNKFNDDDTDFEEPTNLVLEGRKAVLEAINNEKPIDRILIRKDKDKPVEGTLRLIAAKARDLRLVVQEVERMKLDEVSETGHHQGVIALCPAVPYVEVSDILAIAKERGEDPFVIVLDGVTDPHNLGAILRSAEAGGVHGVIIPKRRAVGLTGTVARTSSGAITHMAIARVINISRTLEELKAAGLWIASAEMEGKSLFETDLLGPIALVLGAEGEGVSTLVSKNADFKVSIPMLGRMESLNVSVAAGVLVYEVVRSRLNKLKIGTV